MDNQCFDRNNLNIKLIASQSTSNFAMTNLENKDLTASKHFQIKNNEEQWWNLKTGRVQDSFNLNAENSNIKDHKLQVPNLFPNISKSCSNLNKFDQNENLEIKSPFIFENKFDVRDGYKNINNLTSSTTFDKMNGNRNKLMINKGNFLEKIKLDINSAKQSPNPDVLFKSQNELRTLNSSVKNTNISIEKFQKGFFNNRTILSSQNITPSVDDFLLNNCVNGNQERIFPKKKNITEKSNILNCQPTKKLSKDIFYYKEMI